MLQSWKADVSGVGPRHTAAPDSLASLRLESNFIHVTPKEHTGFEMGALRAVSWPDRHPHETLLTSLRRVLTEKHLRRPAGSSSAFLQDAGAPALSQMLPPAGCVTLCYCFAFLSLGGCLVCKIRYLDWLLPSTPEILCF